MRISLGLRVLLVSATVALTLLGGCNASKKEKKKEAKPTSALDDRFGKKPEPGKMISLPSAEVFQPPKGSGKENLISNPSFEQGRDQWQVSNSDVAAYDKTSAVSADGKVSLCVSPGSAGKVELSQEITVAAKTFYAVGLLSLIPDDGEVSIEVSDGSGKGVISSEAVKGPINDWTCSSLTFVTGASTDKVLFRIHCSGNANAQMLLDQCDMRAIQVQNAFTSGNMEVKPPEAQMPEWFSNGRIAKQVPEGFKSENALLIPEEMNEDAIALGFLMPRPEIEGKRVWVSAMIKSVGKGDAPAPEVTMTLRMTGPDGASTDVVAKAPGTGEWTETTFMATIPRAMDEAAAAKTPPNHLFIFDRPKGVKGKVLIDDVSIFPMPDGRFDGGLTPAAA